MVPGHVCEVLAVFVHIFSLKLFKYSGCRVAIRPIFGFNLVAKLNCYKSKEAFKSGIFSDLKILAQEMKPGIHQVNLIYPTPVELRLD